MAFSIAFTNITVTMKTAQAVDVFSALTSYPKATHLWFKNFEPSSCTSVVIALGVVPVPSAVLISTHLPSTVKAVYFAYLLFYATLITSIVTYRISPLHPLAKHPGPLVCKISKLWSVWIASGGKLHRYHKDLHDKYGPIVRVGPNELSIIEKDLIPSILGTHGMPRGPIMDGRRIVASKDRGEYNLPIQRDMRRHAQLRKAWNKAFANLAMKDYEELLVPRALQLIERLECVCRAEQDGVGHVDIAKWISFFSFDFMGDMAFGSGFELMRDGDKDLLWYNVEASRFLPSLVQHIPWLAGTLRALPFIGANVRAFSAFAMQRAKIRASQDIKKKDLFHYLMEATTSEELASPLPLMLSNSALIIIAGSETTASVLSNIVYYLLSSPDDFARLREEIDHAFTLDGNVHPDVDKLPKLGFLNAVINEVLRLQPPLPTSLQRAPAEGSRGKMVGPHYIPEGTAIQVPPYTLQRDPRYFLPNPDKFWPERWLIQGDNDSVIVDHGAFIPFSIGPANCAGKTLAILELRYVLALLVMKFEVSFDDGYNPATWEDSLGDRFTLVKGELPVKLKLRDRMSMRL